MIKQGKSKTITQTQLLIKHFELPKIQQSVVGDKTPKKTLMKTLFVSQLFLKSISIQVESNERIYTFNCNLLENSFVIKENMKTNEKKLYQESHLLDSSTSVCDLFLQKLAV